ncbi:MAG: FAD-binding protein, partial [Pirellulales bacterium]
MIQANTIDEVRDAVTSHDRIKVCAGNSKPALTDGANLSLQSLNGVLEYQPSEYTFTALAGTRISEVEDLLAQNRQYLPFDPPLAAAGATVGGTVAAGLSGSGRYRYGGVRDFLIGVTFISGDGRTVSGGGKVVKNAAGFDIPKLMVGSLGRFGVLVELTFKVFPARDASATIAIDTGDLPSAISLMNTLAVSSEDLDRLDLEPPGRLMVRISGIHDALSARIARVKRLIPPDATVDDID